MYAIRLNSLWKVAPAPTLAKTELEGKGSTKMQTLLYLWPDVCRKKC